MTESKLILEAIARRRCLDAVYNRTRMTLAPHILYTRHGDLFVDAVALERDGKVPAERKLGTYKLLGLEVTALIDKPFVLFEGFSPADEKYRDVTLLAVE